MLAQDQGLAQLGFAVFEQWQSCPANVPGRAVASRSDLVLDERTLVLVEAEGRVLAQVRNDTNYWYSSYAAKSCCQTESNKSTEDPRTPSKSAK